MLFAMDHPNECLIPWTQPEGRWQARGADLACLRLACGISPGEIASPVVDKEGHTLWHYWAHGPAPQDLIEHLDPVAERAYRNGVSRSGEHPLHRLAVAGRHAALVAWTARYDKEPWPLDVNRHGDNLVASAMWSGDAKTAKWAISGRVGDMDNQDHGGLTCLMVAVHRCNEQVVQALLAAGADPGACDAQGRTALHHAASRGLEDMFVLIEDAGCDPEQKDKAGTDAQSLLARASKSDSLGVLAAHWQRRARARLDF